MEISYKGAESKKIYDANSSRWHGENYELLDLIFPFVFNPDKINKNRTDLLRYRQFLPIENADDFITFSEGFTPLIPVTFSNGLKAEIKLDFLFPTGSYKDRGSMVLLSKIKALGIKKITQDSSGNAGASVAAYAAKAGIQCEVFLPVETPLSKVVQIQAFNALVQKINGNRKETAAIAFEAAKSNYYASHSFNPYFFQGTKTFAYEVMEQLNWKTPDAVILPAGNGTLLLGCFIGFSEMFQGGAISKIPKLIAIQSENCAPLVQLKNNTNFNIQNYIPTDTLAEGIAIPNPIRAKQMLAAVQDSNGEIITVNEFEIIEAWKEMASIGYLIEPTSAATIAGLLKYGLGSNQTEKIVSLFSGTGLKSMDKIQKMLNK